MTPASTEIVFRLSSTTDDERILELFGKSFNRVFSDTWWEWFSYKCPTGKNRTFVAEDSVTKQFAGSYSILPIRLRYNDKDISASLCTMVNTHPNYQGQGLFVKLGHFSLAQAKSSHIPITLGMPNKKAYPGHIKVGWEVMCELPFLVKKNLRPRNHHCKEIGKFDERVDELLQAISKRFTFVVLKDHRFLNWRYVDRPDIDYKIFTFEKNTKLMGYVILKHFQYGGYKKSHILDIQALSDEILKELIAVSENFAAGSDELNLWTNVYNPYQEAFLEESFIEEESADLLIIHYNEGEKMPDNKAWWFCLGDNDVY